LILLGLGAAAFVIGNRSEHRTTTRTVVWFLFATALAYAPASRTAAASAYYLAPALAFGFGALAVLAQSSSTAKTAVLRVLIVVSVLATQLYAHSKEAAAIFWERRVQSAQFREKHLVDATIARLRGASQLCMRSDPRDPAPHLWTQADSAYALLRFARSGDDDEWLRRVKLVQVATKAPGSTSDDCVELTLPYPALPRNVLRWLL
jgi:hypothetical protein